HRPVAVPADARSGAVFGNQRVLQRRRIDPGETRGPITQWQQESRYFISPLNLARGKIVMPPERDDAPIAEIAVKLEGSEIERLKPLDELGLLTRCDQPRAIFEPVRQSGGRLIEQAELSMRSHTQTM